MAKALPDACLKRTNNVRMPRCKSQHSKGESGEFDLVRSQFISFHRASTWRVIKTPAKISEWPLRYLVAE